jgi:hypothetical protein
MSTNTQPETPIGFLSALRHFYSDTSTTGLFTYARANIRLTTVTSTSPARRFVYGRIAGGRLPIRRGVERRLHEPTSETLTEFLNPTRWYAIGHLPHEDVGRGHDREGAKNYSELLEQRPVLETLEIVERHFRSIVPDREL